MQLELSGERQAQLHEYAQRHGQDLPTALDEVLAAALEWERQDYVEALEAICEGFEDIEAGRTQPASEMFEELRVKHGFPR